MSDKCLFGGGKRFSRSLRLVDVASAPNWAPLSKWDVHIFVTDFAFSPTKLKVGSDKRRVEAALLCADVGPPGASAWLSDTQERV